MFSPRFAFFAILALAAAHIAPAHARPISIAVVGDLLANDLGNGMEDIFAGKQVRVIKQTRFATGLVRTDYFNWNATVRNALAARRRQSIWSSSSAATIISRSA